MLKYFPSSGKTSSPERLSLISSNIFLKTSLRLSVKILLPFISPCVPKNFSVPLLWVKILPLISVSTSPSLIFSAIASNSRRLRMSFAIWRSILRFCAFIFEISGESSLYAESATGLSRSISFIGFTIFLAITDAKAFASTNTIIAMAQMGGKSSSTTAQTVSDAPEIRKTLPFLSFFA